MRKIIKSSNTEQVNTFRLHYFPNIPVPQAGGDDRARAEGSPAEGAARQAQALPQGARRLSADDGRRNDPAEIERQAYDAGFRQGEQDGRAAAQQAAAPLTAALEATLAELAATRSRIRQQLEREVVELALHVARKVIHHELSVSEDALLCVVKEAMGHLEDPGKISIRLNPEDLKRIQDTGERMQMLLEQHDDIQFDADPGVDCGGCYIQTEYGEIDARIEEQLRRIEEAFRAEMRNTVAEDE